MTDNLVKALRAIDHLSVEDCFCQSGLYDQAADAIETLTAERDRFQRAFAAQSAKLQIALDVGGDPVRTALVATDNKAIRKIIGGTPATWIDFSDKDTWFKDPELTIFAIYPEDVRYVKNKAGPGCVKVDFIEVDEEGRHYVPYNYEGWQR